MKFFKKLEEGVWYLEDLTAVIQLDLSQAQSYHLFFTEGGQVVVQGQLLDGIFRVEVLKFLLLSLLKQ